MPMRAFQLALVGCEVLAGGASTPTGWASRRCRDQQTLRRRQATVNSVDSANNTSFAMSELVQRTSRMLSASLVEHERAFNPQIGVLRGEFAKHGALGGSAYREAMKNACSEELHKRAVLIVGALLKTHTDMALPPSSALLRQCKNWLPSAVNDEARKLSIHLWHPQPAFNENGAPDNIDGAIRVELDAANAELDNWFDRINRDRTERVVRWIVRILRGARGALSAVLGK